MAKDSSATTRQHTLHVNQTTRTTSVINAFKERVQAVLNDESLDARSRRVIRDHLGRNDQWLAELICSAETDEGIDDGFDFSKTQERSEADSTHKLNKVEPTSRTNKDDSSTEKIEALAEVICRGADESAAALLVLMDQFEESTDPSALAHTVKHFAFTRCGELNLFGMVDAQIAAVKRELCGEDRE